MWTPAGPHPGSVRTTCGAASHRHDVVPGGTAREGMDSGPTNNWMAPEQMKARMTELYRGSMQGRTMYVIPFVMGHLEATVPMFGVEITDSAYVVVSMLVMARCGDKVLRKIEETDAA